MAVGLDMRGQVGEVLLLGVAASLRSHILGKVVVATLLIGHPESIEKFAAVLIGGNGRVRVEGTGGGQVQVEPPGGVLEERERVACQIDPSLRGLLHLRPGCLEIRGLVQQPFLLRGPAPGRTKSCLILRRFAPEVLLPGVERGAHASVGVPLRGKVVPERLLLGAR